MDEEQILKFWKENKIYGKSKKKNEKGKKFYMMDGPPYATGNIHMGTALNKISKDIAMRGHRLMGFDVFDRPGYDTHGVPIEFKVEKEINAKTKKDIEKFGIKKFIKNCKEFATRYIEIMNFEFENLGVWMDFENPYLTLEESYIETIWDVFKVANKKGLLYLGKYPIHICPRCETAVAYNEIEYAKQEDNSIFVKFPLKENKYLIIWTTTPWTLPGNTGVMVNPNFDYQEIKVDNEIWIIAKELVDKIMKEINKKYKIIKTFKGKKMENWEYKNPLNEYLKVNPKNSYRVVLSSRYVNLEEGSGLVHCAPGHGKEDYEVGKKNKLDSLCPVDINGIMTEEAGKYNGGKAREIDEQIINDLEKDNYLVYKKRYVHDYPFCWRCKSPLLMISIPQWFLRISKIQKEILKENEKTNWIPEYMKLRMKAWLESISDWPISRKRYWGTPLPIWQCECGEKIVIGSLNELRKLGGNPKGIHRPEIDEVFLKCKCGKKMKRVEEVLDVWFDSGVSSWAALNKKQFTKFWPADLNLEGKDQIRGWWNSQLILSHIKYKKKPFQNIFVHGMVLDLGKRKMSKSKGNIISPNEIIEKYSRDYLRYYFAKVSKGEDFAFDEKEFNEIRKIFIILSNTNNFINQINLKKEKLKIEDKWILSRYNNLLKNAKEKYKEFRFNEIIQLFEDFLIKDLSRTYIQIIRERQEEVYNILNEIRIGLIKIIAPIIPFLTEKIYQELKNKKLVKEESIHLSKWPKHNDKLIDKNLEKDFSLAFEIIEKGLAERDKEKIGLKWPLSKAIIYNKDLINKNLYEIIKNQLNVKDINVKEGKEISVKLDTKLTPELEAEGYAREISRKIQASRKKSGFVKEDKIKLNLLLSKKLENLLNKNPSSLGFIKEKTNSKELIVNNLNDKKSFKNNFEENIKGEKLTISFKKV